MLNKKYLILFNIILNIAALSIFMLKLFYPYYRIVAFIVYGLGWIPFIILMSNIRISKKQKKEITSYKKPIFIALISLITLWLIFALFPASDFKILLSDKIILQEKLNSEQIYAENYIIKLKESESFLIKELQNASLESLTPEKKNAIREHWRDYLNYFTALNKINSDNRYFYQINYLKYRELNEQSFMLAYSSFVAAYASAQNIISTAKEVEFIESLLNEEVPEYDIPKNSYLMLEILVADPENIPQNHAGYLYMQLIKQESLQKLKSQASEDYKTILKNIPKSPFYRIGGAIDYFESNAFKAWFPVQKEVSETLGDTKIPLRESSLVSLNDLRNLQSSLEPGDVLLQRRNWYLSNAGLPGFWKHTAIYISNLSLLDSYFEEATSKTSITSGKKVSKFIQANYPKLYKAINDNKLRTIEAESEGIVSLTLENSASVDYLAVLRPNVTKEEKLNALVYLFKQFEKPYDFNFDFTTDKELVCSEIYYKAYPQINHKLREVSGRLVLSTNHIVQDFKESLSNKLIFITFLDGIEKEKLAVQKNESEFKESWTRHGSDLWTIAQLSPPQEINS